MKPYKFIPAFCFLMLLCFFSRSFSQPVVDTTWLPNAGETFNYFFANYPNNFNKNHTGANVTWDFSNLQVNNAAFSSSNFILPDSLNVNCYYPDVNLLAGNSDKYDCLLKDNSGYYVVGQFYLEDGYLFKHLYSRKALLLKVPFTYNNSLTDSFAYVYSTTIDSFGHVTFKDSAISVEGISYISCDGYGKLKLHDGEYDNVLRIKTIRFIKDSGMINNPNGNRPNFIGVESYSWRYAGLHVSIFTISNTYLLARRPDNLFDTTFTKTGVVYTKQQTSGYSIKNTNELKLKAYTTTEGIRIESTENIPQQLRLSLYNMQGKLVEQKDITISGSYLLPVHQMPAGKYILQVYTKEGTNKSFSLFLK